MKAGVIDAAKVTRSALQNAASIAALFLTTEAVIADKPEEDPTAAACPAEAWRTSKQIVRNSVGRLGGHWPLSLLRFRWMMGKWDSEAFGRCRGGR